MGTFANGLTAFGTPLPAANDGPNNDAVYAGGLGVAAGVVLCTGAVTDSDASNPAIAGRGVGVQGPNNGYRINNVPMENHDGEIGLQIQASGTIDADFDRAVFGSNLANIGPDSSDPVVLQFEVQTEYPAYLRISTVFGSDEYPHYIQEDFNDSFAMLIKKSTAANTTYENIAILNDHGALKPFSLQAIFLCGAPQFIENQVAPEPATFLTSLHAIKNGGSYDSSAPLYDHEFGGFTALRTWETACPYPPGTYTVKIVVHDVIDGIVDAGLFIKGDSLKAYTFDFADLDGDVDGGDYSILYANWQECGKKFTEGDANGDGCVNEDDYDILVAAYFNTGTNRDLKFDFNRDNVVDGTDFLIFQQNVTPLGVFCRSRFEGDADGDGDVDSDDLPPSGSTAPAVTGCGEHGGHMRSGGGDELIHGESAVYNESADLDQDGDVDFDDVKLFGESIEQE